MTVADPRVPTVRLVAVDMDGTFLDAHGGYDRDRFERIHQHLTGAGVGFVVASGNQHAQLVAKFRPGGDIWFIAENGGVIARDAQLVRTTAFDPDVLAQLRTRTDDLPGVLSVSCGATTAFVLEGAAAKLLAIVRPYLVHLRQVAHWSNVSEPIVKVGLVCRPEATEQLVRRLRRELPATVAVVSSGHGFLDLIPAHSNKGVALEWLAARLEVPMAQVVAFGDGGNDVEMLAGAGLGVAMANAPEAVKAIADDVTASNVEGGVLRYLEAMWAAGSFGAGSSSVAHGRVGGSAAVQ